MSKVVKSLLCGLLIAQVSTVAVAADSKIASTEIEKCSALKSQPANAELACVVDANTKLVERRLSSEKKLRSLFAACQVKMAQHAALAPFVSFCKQEAAKRAKAISLASIEETLTYQKGLITFVTEKTAMNPTSRAELLAAQTEAIKANAGFIENAETQLAVAAGPIKQSYKNVTKKNFVF